MTLLSPKGVTPEMKFPCCDCGEETSGADVMSGNERLQIVECNAADPLKSKFRCECCQDEHHERNCLWE